MRRIVTMAGVGNQNNACFIPGARRRPRRRKSNELAVEKIIALEGQINAKIDDLLKIKQQVEKAIQTVQDGTLREVLIQRYILGKRWEQIAVDMNYSWRRIYQLHGKALLQLCIEFQYKPVI